jgi:hypothetical protein
MQVSWYRKPFKLWLVGTVILVIGVGLILRPDRDAAQYLRYQHVQIDEADIRTRQLLTHYRLFRNEGLVLDQIKARLLNNPTFDNATIDKITSLETALNTKVDVRRRLTRFAAIALVPPLVILELGAAWFWVRRALRAWRNKPNLDLGRSASVLNPSAKPPQAVGFDGVRKSRLVNIPPEIGRGNLE